MDSGRDGELEEDGHLRSLLSASDLRTSVEAVSKDEITVDTRRATRVAMHTDALLSQHHDYPSALGALAASSTLVSSCLGPGPMRVGSARKLNKLN